MVVVVVVARDDVANHWVAWGGLGVIGVWSLWEFARVRSPMTQRLAGTLAVIETGLAAALLIADPWVWESAVGALWLVAGIAAGAVVERLGRAERRVAQAEVREEMARELHDGVLQTLAVVQRRSTDDELSRLARDQEIDLRSWLFGDDDLAAPELALGPALRDAARRAERTHRLRVQVVGVGLDEDGDADGGGDRPEIDPSIIAALAADSATEVTENAIWFSPWASGHYANGSHWHYSAVKEFTAPAGAWG